jgi:hypothetical protein
MLTAWPDRACKSPGAISGDGSAIFSGLRRGSTSAARFERRCRGAAAAGATGSTIIVFSEPSVISTEFGDNFVEKLGCVDDKMNQSTRS